MKPLSSTLYVHFRQEQFRIVDVWLCAIERSIPAVQLKTLLASIRDWGLGSLKGPAEHGTADAGRPVAVSSSVAHGCDVISIENDSITLCGIVLQVES